MSSDNDPVAIPMIERNSYDLPEIDTSDLKTLTGEAVLSFHNISYQETVHHGFLFCKKPRVVERLSNIRYVYEAESTALNNFSKHRISLLSISCGFMCVCLYMCVCM